MKPVPGAVVAFCHPGGIRGGGAADAPLFPLQEGIPTGEVPGANGCDTPGGGGG